MIAKVKWLRFKQEPTGFRSTSTSAMFRADERLGHSATLNTDSGVITLVQGDRIGYVHLSDCVYVEGEGRPVEPVAVAKAK